MMRPADGERARRILDRLDARLEGQTFGDGADAPHAVALVGAFHRAAGNLERDLDQPSTSIAFVGAMLRALRSTVRTHANVVAMHGIALRAQRAALAARAREQGGR